MLPIFGNERRRPINLGGSTPTSSTHAAILDRAKALRSERQDARNRILAAVKIQAWWRGIFAKREVQREVRRMFFEDAWAGEGEDGVGVGLMGLRCLVILGGRHEDVLGIWSERIGEEGVFRLAVGAGAGGELESWMVLMRKASLLLLQSVANAPQSRYAVSHLKILTAVLSREEISGDLLRHLLPHDYYPLLARAIASIPIESKSSPSLPLLVPLTTLPFTPLQSTNPSTIPDLLCSLIHTILSIPLLPNRLPLPSLSHFSATLPLASSLSLLTPAHVQYVVQTTGVEDKINIIANFQAFMPPRYATLSVQAMEVYLGLVTMMLNALPVNALDPPKSKTSSSSNSYAQLHDSDSDDEDDTNRASAVLVSSFTPPSLPPPPLPSLPPRTLKRLSLLPSATHISSLLFSSHHTHLLPSVVSFLLALGGVWPGKRVDVLTSFSGLGGGLIREVWRGWVRGGGLGRDGGDVCDAKWRSEWPMLLFLSEVYTQALVTMGDDEFFSQSQSSSSSNMRRNPLTLDDLSSFSRKLLNIAFTLYSKEGSGLSWTLGLEMGLNGGGGDVGLGPRWTWEAVRESVGKCLIGIHARDSRKPFLKPGHWLASEKIDLDSFVEAAIYEEQQLSSSSTQRPLSKRQIAYLSPRLGILNNIPFSIPFEVRVKMFRSFVVGDMVKRGVTRYEYGGRVGRTRVTVRRGNVSVDGFDKLGEADLKAPVEITFVDQFGQEEAGIDGGGVFKEFFTELCKEVFDTDRGLWLATDKHELYPNPHAYATEPHSLSWYRFIGRILGKALYEGILVDVAFTGFFLAKWLGKQSFLDDLASLDNELYQGLVFLKHYQGNPEDLSLNFTVAVDELGIAKTHDLIPNGSNIAVTRENRLQYIYLISHYRLSKQIKFQSEAFFEGLLEMIDAKWLRMFNQQELQILLGGVNSPVDLDDLRAHTNYGGAFDDKDDTIKMFWAVVEGFDQEQRRALLRFATSCSRPPLLGFKELVPNFAIRCSGDDQERLPTSSTCVNLLKLPRYRTPQLLRVKLLQAITSGAGFDLS